MVVTWLLLTQNTSKKGADTWSNIGRGEDYSSDKMTSHFPIVLEQKTIVFQNIGGGDPSPPRCPQLIETG